MEHYHYARWLTVHVTDCQELQNDSPDTHREFVKGNLVTQKSSHKFSALAHDQIHEQQNAIGKVMVESLELQRMRGLFAVGWWLVWN